MVGRILILVSFVIFLSGFRCAKIAAVVSSCLLGGCVSQQIPSAQTENWNPQKDLHIAFLGDSTATDFVGGSKLSDIRSLYSKSDHNLVLDNTANQDPHSIFERLKEEGIQVKISNYARPGAYVFLNDQTNSPPAELRSTLNIPSLKEEVDRLMREKDFPNLIAIWIGHNDIFFWDKIFGKPAVQELASGQKLINFVGPEMAAEYMTEDFEDELLRQLDRLRLRAIEESHRTSIVVFGLANFEQLVKAKTEIKTLRKNDNTKFSQFRPLKSLSEHPIYDMDGADINAYWGNKVAIDLNQQYNAILERSVESMNQSGYGKVQFIFSPAITKTPLTIQTLSVDGTHPNDQARSSIAEAVVHGFESARAFLEGPTVARSRLEQAQR